MVSSAATRSLLNQSLSPGPVSHSKGRSPTKKKAKNGEITIIPETPDTDIMAKREKARRRSLAALEKVLEEDFKRDQQELEEEEKQNKQGTGKPKGRKSMLMENISRIGSPASSR